MKKRMFLLIILAAILTAPAMSLEHTIDYLDGFLDIKEDGDWYELGIGETVLDTDVIRLDEDSVAEISARGVKLTLTNRARRSIR